MGGSLPLEESSVKIQISHGMGIPKSIEEIEIQSWVLLKEKNFFQTETRFLFRSNPVEEPLRTILSLEGIEINLPWKGDFPFSMFGNDFSFYNLFYSKALTLRGAAFFMSERLFLFLGNSGTGKTTLLEKGEKDPRVSLLADDHLHIIGEKESIQVVAPVWDQAVEKGLNLPVRLSKRINIFIFTPGLEKNLVEIKEIPEKLTLIVPHIVLWGVHILVTEIILDLLPDLLAHARLFLLKPRNTKENWEIVAKHF